MDLSLSILRAVSPVHLEYLRNMDVRASLSISIVLDGRLWGLFACHNATPAYISFGRRTVAELFAQMFSLELANRIRREIYQSEGNARDIHQRIMASVAVDGAIFDNLSDYLEHFRQMIPCDGVGLWVDGDYALAGPGPDESEMAALARFLNRASASQVFSMNDLSRQFPEAEGFSAEIAGLLAIPVSRAPRDYLVFFRRELAQSVTWAGNPEKPVEAGPGGLSLTPRKSFEAWREVVRGQSAPWTESELRIAGSLRITLLEIMLRHTDYSEKVRQQAQEKQDLLIGELNHRVRNILSLIRGIVAQTGERIETVNEFTKVLSGRVQALANAHDQLTNENWSPAPLKTLIESEVDAYHSEKRERIAIAGPNVTLDPQAFTCAALVLHELVTNSAKYGSLSVSDGKLDISWSLDDAGALLLEWREHGGPPVEPPRQRGFGSTIIERSIPFDLKGEAEVDYAETGVTARFLIPSRFVRECSEPVDRSVSSPPGAVRALPLESGSAVLLVEDNIVIAMDVEDMLREIGFAEVMTSASVDDALNVLAGQRPLAAILDIDLGDETSIGIAETLRKSDIPFIFASGYGDSHNTPEGFHDVPVLTKPYTAANLGLVLSRVVGG